MSLDSLTTTFSEAVARTGPYAPAILFLASFVEYVFPPFPGDLLVVMGAWYAVQGQLSWPLTFLSVTAGAVAGAFVDWEIGRWLAPRLDAGAARRGGAWAERLARFAAAYQRWGSLLLLANRFFPSVRAFVFVAAGAVKVPLGRVLLLGAISAALWNVLLLALGALVAQNVDDLVRWVQKYTAGALIALALLAVGIALVSALRRRSSRPGPAPEDR